MRRWMIKLRPLAAGGVTLGVLQGVQAIDFNRVWFEFVLTWLAVLVNLLFGGDLSTVSSTGGTSPFSSFFT